MISREEGSEVDLEVTHCHTSAPAAQRRLSRVTGLGLGLGLVLVTPIQRWGRVGEIQTNNLRARSKINSKPNESRRFSFHLCESLGFTRSPCPELRV
jgi:hypothetical protein